VIRRRLSRLIPLLLISSSLIGSALLFWAEMRYATQEIEQNGVDEINATMTYLQNVLNTQLANDNFEDAKLSMSVTALHPAIQSILLADESDRVLLANRYIWEGEPAAKYSGYRNVVAAQVRDMRANDVSYNAQTGILSGYYPISLRVGAEGLVTRRFGVLFVEHDLTTAIARARYKAMVWAAVASAITIIVAIVIAALLNHLVSRRVRRIVEVTQKVADGDLSARVEMTGRDELAELAHAFDAMVFQRMSAEAMLRHSEQTLRFMLQTSPVAVTIVTDQPRAIIFANQSYAELVKLEQEQIRGSDPRVYYANPEECQAAMLELEAGGELRNRLTELMIPGVGTRWVLASYLKLEYQQQPTVLQWLYDITDRKRIEDELQLASLVYQNSSEAIEVVDEHNRIIAINPAYTEMTGYSEAEVLGQNPSVLSSGHHDQAFYDAMWQELNSSGHWQGEIWDRRKDGDAFPIWVTINTVFNKLGEVHRRLAIFSDISKKKQAEELIWKQANYDALTGLPNRRMFRDRLDQEIKKAHRHEQAMALLFVDLDRFKEVNDTLGHHIGDDLLIVAAQRIEACVRESDTVARLGGDEFTVIIPQLADSGHVEEIASAIIARLVEPFHLGEEKVQISASVGITLYPDDGTELEQLLKNADQAMYVAKQQGRNRFSYFTASLQEAAQRRQQMIAALREALDAEQFSIHFQPIVALESGRINKAEALLRWNHPQHGFISPAEFIPICEEIGLINTIGDWVFRESVRWAKRWCDAFDGEFQVSVNMSPVQFLDADNASDHWSEYLQQAGVSGANVVVEITEGLLLGAESRVADRLLKYRDAGMEVAIDDFGTGYSALSYLNKFDIDYLKIDKSFVDHIVENKHDMALSEAIVVMAHKLGLKVIAEGIETEEQHSLLMAAGCDYGQGYLFSRALPPEEFAQLLQQQQDRPDTL
jgi:diguanylate cyclase (GGDEF)-like protein/PAS domain S-box-containing protein